MSIEFCPRCSARVRVPVAAEPESWVRCPRCRVESQLSEILSAEPPLLELIDGPSGEVPSYEPMLAGASAAGTEGEGYNDFDVMTSDPMVTDEDSPTLPLGGISLSDDVFDDETTAGGASIGRATMVRKEDDELFGFDDNQDVAALRTTTDDGQFVEVPDGGDEEFNLSPDTPADFGAPAAAVPAAGAGFVGMPTGKIRRKKKSGMLPMMLGVVFGGLFGILIAYYGILIWAMGRDPFKVAKMFPESMQMLFPDSVLEKASAKNSNLSPDNGNGNPEAKSETNPDSNPADPMMPVEEGNAPSNASSSATANGEGETGPNPGLPSLGGGDTTPPVAPPMTTDPLDPLAMPEKPPVVPGVDPLDPLASAVPPPKPPTDPLDPFGNNAPVKPDMPKPDVATPAVDPLDPLNPGTPVTPPKPEVTTPAVDPLDPLATPVKPEMPVKPEVTTPAVDPLDPLAPKPVDPLTPKPADPIDPLAAKPVDPLDPLAPKPVDPLDPLAPKPADPLAVKPIDPLAPAPADPLAAPAKPKEPLMLATASYAPEELLKSMMQAEAAAAAMAQAPGDRTALAQAYRAYGHIGEVAGQLKSLGETDETAQVNLDSIQTLTKKLADDPAIPVLNSLTFYWQMMGLDKRNHGIIIQGTPGPSEALGKFHKASFDFDNPKPMMPGVKLTVVSEYPLLPGKDGKVTLLGVIVEKPTEQIPGYTGPEERVIWASVAPLDKPAAAPAVEAKTPEAPAPAKPPGDDPFGDIK